MLRLGSSEYRQEAIVIEDLSTDLLLGNDWLKKNGAAINFARNTLTIGRQEFQLILPSLLKYCHCCYCHQNTANFNFLLPL